jgi:hypothetical protein
VKKHLAGKPIPQRVSRDQFLPTRLLLLLIVAFVTPVYAFVTEQFGLVVVSIGVGALLFAWKWRWWWEPLRAYIDESPRAEGHER